MTTVITDSGLSIEDLSIGTGVECTGHGQTAIVHYTGWLEDGTKFDSSLDINKTFSFPLACNYVIKGWDEGVIGMKEGGKRKLIIPADLAYGEAGYGTIIPANATLTFELELIEISE